MLRTLSTLLLLPPVLLLTSCAHTAEPERAASEPSPGPAAVSPQATVHRGPIDAVAFSPSSEQLAFSSGDSVQIVAVPGGAVRFQGFRQGAPLEGVGLLSGAETLVGGAGHTLLVWDVTAGEPSPQRLQYTSITGTSAGGSPSAFALSPETGYAATAAIAPPGAPRLVLWDVSGRRIAAQLARTPEEPAQQQMRYGADAVAFSPQGDRVAITLQPEAKLQVWNVPSGELLQEVDLPDEAAVTQGLAFSPDGRHLAVATAGYNDAEGWYMQPASIIDLQEPPHLRALPADAAAYSVAFGPEGKQLLTGLEDGVMQVWEVDSGTLVRTTSQHAGTVRALAVSPNGRMLASGSSAPQGEGNLMLWSME